MLDDYQKKQPIIYQILKNAIKKEKLSHAYLFETGGFYDSMNFVLSFVKAINCPNNYTNNKKCQNCKQCQIIESGNYPEIKIINPDGMWIKKDQLKELQEEYNKKAIIGKKKIYIINNAEKLNISAANSILKFLEEPEEGIIAILLTENIYQILETIRSRCQIIKLREETKKYKEESTIERINDIINNKKEIEEEKKLKIEKVINFVNYYEKNQLDTILYMQKLWNDYIKTKEEMQKSFDIIILYYRDILNYIMKRKIEIFTDYQEEIEKISKNNNLQTLSNKLKIISEFKEKIKYNANTNLLMDKLMITLEGGIK